MVLCGYSDLLQKEVSLSKAERASQIHGYKSVCKAISSHHLEDIRKTTAAASSVRQRTRFTPHSQTLILSLGSLLTSNQKGLSYSITCIHYYTREHITLGQDSTQELQLGNFVASFSPSLALNQEFRKREPTSSIWSFSNLLLLGTAFSTQARGFHSNSYFSSHFSF